MNEPRELPVRIDADISGFERAMADISASTKSFAGTFASSMAQAALSGRDLDDALRAVALRIASLSLERALAPLEGLIASGLAGAVSPQTAAAPLQPQQRSMSLVMNVQASDAASFRKSEAQISTLLARAVSRGRRGL
jgi:hypothetical protein